MVKISNVIFFVKKQQQKTQNTCYNMRAKKNNRKWGFQLENLSQI